MKGKRFSSQDHTYGFTLVEMLVATFLLAVGIVGAQICLAHAARTSALAKEYNRAAYLGREQMTTILSNSDDMTVGSHNGDFSPDYPNYTWECDVDQPDPTNYPNLMHVTLTISWMDGSVKKSLQLETYGQAPTTTNSTPTSPFSSNMNMGGGF
jgi:prepilin-type N-terminal cleavage/methylation domain-containing protein